MDDQTKRDGKKPAGQQPETSENGSDPSMTARIASSAAGLAKDIVRRPDNHHLARYAAAGVDGSSKAGPSSSSPFSAWEGIGSPGTRNQPANIHSSSTSSSMENFRTSLQGLDGVSGDLREYLSEDGLERLYRQPIESSSLWRNEFIAGQQEQGIAGTNQMMHSTGDTFNGGPVQQSDGAEVSFLLSRSDMMDVEPLTMADIEPSDQTVADLFGTNQYTAEERQIADRMKSSLPPPAEHHSIHPLNPLNLIPGVEELALSLEEGEGSYLNFDSLQREHWLHEWDDVLNRYSDDVWGDGLSDLEQVRTKLHKVAETGQTLDSKAVNRLKMILGHITASAELVDEHVTPENREETVASIRKFHCPWMSCNEVCLS